MRPAELARGQRPVELGQVLKRPTHSQPFLGLAATQADDPLGVFAQAGITGVEVDLEALGFQEPATQLTLVRRALSAELDDLEVDLAPGGSPGLSDHQQARSPSLGPRTVDDARTPVSIRGRVGHAGWIETGIGRVHVPLYHGLFRASELADTAGSGRGSTANSMQCPVAPRWGTSREHEALKGPSSEPAAP